MEFQNICNEMVARFFLRHPVDKSACCLHKDDDLVIEKSWGHWKEWYIHDEKY